MIFSTEDGMVELNAEFIQMQPMDNENYKFRIKNLLERNFHSLKKLKDSEDHLFFIRVKKDRVTETLCMAAVCGCAGSVPH